MRKSVLKAVISTSASFVLGGAAIALDHHGHASWGYEGAGGPEHWGALSADNASCDSGHEQSPINLHAVSEAAYSAPALHWGAGEGLVSDNGHTIKVDLEAAGSLHLDDRAYELVQFHFHAGSEHTVDGQHYPLEAHFVHASDDGHLAVVGVFFEEGATNPALDALWAAIPHEGETHGLGQVDPNAFLPSDHHAWRYAGSLTTPPCSEGVAWTVMQTPITASAGQIEVFTAHYSNNYRPVQALHARSVSAGDLH